MQKWAECHGKKHANPVCDIFFQFVDFVNFDMFTMFTRSVNFDMFIRLRYCYVKLNKINMHSII